MVPISPKAGSDVSTRENSCSDSTEAEEETNQQVDWEWCPNAESINACAKVRAWWKPAGGKRECRKGQTGGAVPYASVGWYLTTFSMLE